MERKQSRRVGMSGLDYKPSQRVMATKPKRGTFKYTGYSPRQKKPRPRTLSRRVLVAAALEEFRSGQNSMVALYAALLIRTLIDADQQIEDMFGSRALNVLEDR